MGKVGAGDWGPGTRERYNISESQWWKGSDILMEESPRKKEIRETKIN